VNFAEPHDRGGQDEQQEPKGRARPLKRVMNYV
jgi:hypothetical protein